MKRGRKPKTEIGYSAILVKGLVWIILAAFFTFLFRTFRSFNESMMSVFGPGLLVIFVLVVVYVIYKNIYVRQSEPMPSGFILGERKLRFSESGIEEVASNHTSQFRWSAVIDIVNDEDYVYLFLDSTVAHIIPKRVFTSPDETETFLSSIKMYREQNAT